MALVNYALSSTLTTPSMNLTCFQVSLSVCSVAEFDSRIIGLTGPVAAVRQMAQEYRVYFKKVEEDGSDYLVDCSHNM